MEESNTSIIVVWSNDYTKYSSIELELASLLTVWKYTPYNVRKQTVGTSEYGLLAGFYLGNRL